jgi:hypothetical protein
MMVMASNTFKVIRSPNRPLQIDRAAYAQVMHLLRQAENDLFDVEVAPADREQVTRAQNALQRAIDKLRTETGSW